MSAYPIAQKENISFVLFSCVVYACMWINFRTSQENSAHLQEHIKIKAMKLWLGGIQANKELPSK